MEFKRIYQGDRGDYTISIRFHEERLDSFVIQRGNEVLEHLYQDDVLLDCLYNGHSQVIEHKHIIGPIAGSSYKDGLIQESEGLKFEDDVQLRTINSYIQDLYYRGIYIGELNSEKVLRNNYYEAKVSDDEIEIVATNRDAPYLNFLLGFETTRSFPFNRIINLPAIGLFEFIHAMSDLFKAGIYLTYMDGLFGSSIKDLTVDSTEIEGTYDIKAKLHSCYMEMITSDVELKYCILDSSNNFHDYGLGREDTIYHREVLALKKAW